MFEFIDKEFNTLFLDVVIIPLLEIEFTVVICLFLPLETLPIETDEDEPPIETFIDFETLPIVDVVDVPINVNDADSSIVTVKLPILLVEYTEDTFNVEFNPTDPLLFDKDNPVIEIDTEHCKLFVSLVIKLGLIILSFDNCKDPTLLVRFPPTKSTVYPLTTGISTNDPPDADKYFDPTAKPEKGFK
jgi:hypothetical protein